MYLLVLRAGHYVAAFRVNVHARVQIWTCGQFLNYGQVLQVVNDYFGLGQDHDLGFLRVEWDLLEYGSSVDEVSLWRGLAEPVNRNDLVLLGVVRTDSHEVIRLCVLELHVSHISLELEPDPEPLPVLFRVLKVIVPLVIISIPRLVNELLSHFHTAFRVPPNHHLDSLPVTETDHIVLIPVDAQNCLFILLWVNHSGTQHLPDHQQPALVACAEVLPVGADWNSADGWGMSVVGDVDCCWEGFQSFWIWQFGDQSVRVDVQLLLLYSGTKVKIEASLESFLDEFVVEWDVPHLVERGRDEVKGSILFVEFFPLLPFVLTEQELLGRVVTLVVAG